MSLQRDPLNRVITPTGKFIEEEVMLNSDFYDILLTDMGLRRFTDIREESDKL